MDRTLTHHLPVRRRVALAVTAALALGVVALAPSLAGTARAATAAPPVTPVLNQNFADPGVMKSGGTYYAYATNNDTVSRPGPHIQWATSPDSVVWTARTTDALPTLGAWVDKGWRFNNGDDGVWAPAVLEAGAGRFVMYYTARSSSAGTQCIGTATSSTPGGPFAAAATPIVCTPATGGNIDPSVFSDSDGKRYLLWKDDGNCCAKPTWIHL